MLKLFIVSILLVSIQGEAIDKFLGDWMFVATFAQYDVAHTCHFWYTFINEKKSVQCDCDGTKKKYPVLRVKCEYYKSDQDFLIHVVNSNSEVQPALKEKCQCDKDYHKMVFKSVSKDYFLEYEILPHRNYTTKEPNTANLAAKREPTLSQLMKDIGRIDEVKRRRSTILCDQLKP